MQVNPGPLMGIGAWSSGVYRPIRIDTNGDTNGQNGQTRLSGLIGPSGTNDLNGPTGLNRPDDRCRPTGLNRPVSSIQDVREWSRSAPEGFRRSTGGQEPAGCQVREEAVRGSDAAWPEFEGVRVAMHRPRGRRNRRPGGLKMTPRAPRRTRWRKGKAGNGPHARRGYPARRSRARARAGGW